MSEFTSRVETMLKARISSLLDQIEDPKQTLDYAFEEQRELLARVREGVDSVIASKRRLQDREGALRTRAAELADQAKRELAAGSEDIARAALAAKTAIETELDSVEDQIAELDRDLAELTAREQDLTAKLDAFKTQKEALAAQATADAAGRAAGVGGPASDMTDLGLAMQRAVEKMGTMGTRADAVEAVGRGGPAQVHPGATPEDPIRRLAELEADRSVDDQLAAMRRELEAGDV